MKTVCLLCGAGRIVTVCGDNSCRCTLRTRGRIEGLQSRLGLVFKKGDRWTTVAPCGASVLLSEQRRWFRELTAAGLAPERGIPAGFTVQTTQLEHCA